MHSDQEQKIKKLGSFLRKIGDNTGKGELETPEFTNKVYNMSYDSARLILTFKLRPWALSFWNSWGRFLRKRSLRNYNLKT